MFLFMAELVDPLCTLFSVEFGKIGGVFKNVPTCVAPDPKQIIPGTIFSFYLSKFIFF